MITSSAEGLATETDPASHSRSGSVDVDMDLEGIRQRAEYKSGDNSDDEGVADGLQPQSGDEDWFADFRQCTACKPLARDMPVSVFGCNTCMDASGSEHVLLAGLCFACAHVCHSGHDTFELYEKRGFVCDCHTQLLRAMNADHSCAFASQKHKLNPSNAWTNDYNHNFKNEFCHCNAEYDCTEWDSEKMQCCLVCEDWFHVECIGELAREALVEDASFICRNCYNEAWHKALRSHSRIVMLLQSADCMVLAPGFEDNICPCASCQVFFEQKHVKKVFYPPKTFSADEPNTEELMRAAQPTIKITEDCQTIKDAMVSFLQSMVE